MYIHRLLPVAGSTKMNIWYFLYILSDFEVGNMTKNTTINRFDSQFFQDEMAIRFPLFMSRKYLQYCDFNHKPSMLFSVWFQIKLKALPMWNHINTKGTRYRNLWSRHLYHSQRQNLKAVTHVLSNLIYVLFLSMLLYV